MLPVSVDFPAILTTAVMSRAIRKLERSGANGFPTGFGKLAGHVHSVGPPCVEIYTKLLSGVVYSMMGKRTHRRDV
jgi:hypothetical protein